MIAKDPKNAEILKPILGGRDIKRYKTEFADLWLIATFPSLNLSIDDYPAVKKYLEQFSPKIKQTGETFFDKNGQKQKSRKKTWNKWFETQDPIAYYKEFEKEKIAWGNLALSSQFNLIRSGIHINAPSPFVASGNKYLLGFLNSSLADYYIRSRGVTRNGGYFEYKPMFVETLPIPQIPKSQQLPFEILVDYILFAKELDLERESQTLEVLINGMVYELYFPEGIKAASCEVLKHLSNLQELKSDWSDKKKLQTIEKIHQELSSPDNPVSVAMEKMKEIEEIKIIEGRS